MKILNHGELTKNPREILPKPSYGLIETQYRLQPIESKGLLTYLITMVGNIANSEKISKILYSRKRTQIPDPESKTREPRFKIQRGGTKWGEERLKIRVARTQKQEDGGEGSQQEEKEQDSRFHSCLH